MFFFFFFLILFWYFLAEKNEKIKFKITNKITNNKKKYKYNKITN